MRAFVRSIASWWSDAPMVCSLALWRVFGARSGKLNCVGPGCLGFGKVCTRLAAQLMWCCSRSLRLVYKPPMIRLIMAGSPRLAVCPVPLLASSGAVIGSSATISTGNSPLCLSGRFPPKGGKGGRNPKTNGKPRQSGVFLCAPNRARLRLSAPKAWILEKVAQVTPIRIAMWETLPRDPGASPWDRANLRRGKPILVWSDLWPILYGPSPTAEAVQRAPATGYQAQGDCHSPVEVVLWDRTSHPSSVGRRGSTTVTGRCRKCEACLRHRARMWYARAMRECEAASRTWFATLTWRGENPCAPYRDIQLYLKRLRKRVGPVRFMAVQEAGDEGGRLHWHMLVHTPSHVRVRHLRLDWPVGFCQFKVATPDKVGYMAAYGVKSLLRVHASVRYGSVQPPPAEGAAVAGVQRSP